MPRVTVAIDQPKSWNSGQFLAAAAEHPASLCTILSRGDTANNDDPQPLCKEGTIDIVRVHGRTVQMNARPAYPQKSRRVHPRPLVDVRKGANCK